MLLSLEFFRFLLNPSRDADLRRWAAEGLAYLSIDADVKEWLVEDPAAIRALVELAKVRAIAHPVAKWCSLKIVV